jgi:anti-sigma regulatory factor (Ser/Thr protein kinase)
MKDALTLKVDLPRIPNIELVAIEGLNRLGQHLGIAEEKIGEARILVTEAVINALEHAGEQNPEVRVEFTATKEKLIIFVRDYGTGFEPSSVEEPDIRAKLGSTHKRGWGLKLMKSMSDDFRIESDAQGTKITLTKKLV